MEKITELNHLEVISFTNVDKEDYEGTYGGNPTQIKTGETKQFPRFLAQHFTKQLINKILLRDTQNHGDGLARKKLEDQILGELGVLTSDLPPQAVPVEPPKEAFEGKPVESSGESVLINELKCEDCGQEFRAKIGLISHRRKHIV